MPSFVCSFQEWDYLIGIFIIDFYKKKKGESAGEKACYSLFNNEMSFFTVSPSALLMHIIINPALGLKGIKEM